MKPIGVLVLVLVAIAGLFFAINNLGGGGETIDPGIDEPIAKDTTEAESTGGGDLRDAPSTNRSETLAPVESGNRVDSSPSAGQGYDNTVVGIVISLDQQRIPGATVTLTRGGIQGVLFQNEDLDRSYDRTATTDAQGQYTFTDVEPYESYSIEARAEGYSQGSVAGIVVDATGAATPPPIVLRVGATLCGRVTDTAGNPVPEAKLHLEGLFMKADGTPGPDSLHAVSDANGDYCIPNIPPGNRRLNVSAEGYANQTKGGMVFRGEDPLTMDVTLEVAEMICGRVINKRGQGVAGAKVLALSYSNTNRQCRDVIMTDENGEFCLERVAAGKYTLAVTAERYRAAHENRVPTGGASLVIELHDQGVVCGRVVAGDGPAPTPFTVQLRRTHPGTNITSQVGKALTFDDPEGNFCIEATQSGTYRVEASAPGYAPSFSEEFRFTLGQPMNGVVAHLTQGGSIVGRLVDSEGNPVSRPRITTHDNTWSNSLFDRALGDQFPTNATKATATGGTGGRFELSNLRGETYQLRFRAHGYCEEAIKDIVVTEGNETDLGDIELTRGGEITGSVIDPAGKPVVGATVRLDPDGPESSSMNYSTQSGADGKYVLKNVYPGPYKLSANQSMGEFDFLSTMANQGDNSQRLTVSEGESLRFELRVIQ